MLSAVTEYDVCDRAVDLEKCFSFVFSSFSVLQGIEELYVWCQFFNLIFIV